MSLTNRLFVHLARHFKSILIACGIWFFLSLFQFQFYMSDVVMQKTAFVFVKSKPGLDWSEPDGPGSQGRAVAIHPELRPKADDLFKIHQFNLMASDMIGVNRSLPDYRRDECKLKKYPDDDLPDASVVIAFYNEAWSALMRTVVSVIQNSPRQLLREIILVDDGSTLEHLKERLDEVIKTLPVPIILERMSTRSGVVKSRLRGSALARGQALVFLDSHCECTTGWLEPLLAIVRQNSTAAACSIIDSIDKDTFAYSAASDQVWGVFNWKLEFNWGQISEREKARRGNDPTALIHSPAMPGGAFAIDRIFFYEIGAYDPNYIVWGGENIELSFRLWLCGGAVLFVPCSHVGHVYRNSSPYEWPGGSSYVIHHNALRTATLWLDQYKDFYVNTAADVAVTRVGDIKKRIDLAAGLECSRFKHYLEYVFPESTIPSRYFSLGYIRSIGSGLCLDTEGADGTSGNEQVRTEDCHYKGGNQLFTITAAGQLMHDGVCLEGDGETVKWRKCSLTAANNENDPQRWVHEPRSGLIINSNSALMLELPDGSNTPILSPFVDEPSMKWEVQNFRKLEE